MQGLFDAWKFMYSSCTKTRSVTVNHIKLLRSVKANYCVFSQVCTNTMGSVYFPGDG